MLKEPTVARGGCHFSRSVTESLCLYPASPLTHRGIGVPTSTPLIGNYLELAIIPILGDFPDKGDIMLNRMKSIKRIMRGRVLANLLVEILGGRSRVVLECQGLGHFARATHCQVNSNDSSADSRDHVEICWIVARI
jgi:hypothetical protein